LNPILLSLPLMAPIRILTLNVNAGFDIGRRRFVLPDLRDAVRAVDADVVLLQEVLGRHSGHARRHQQWPDEAQHEYLAHALWPHHAYGRNAVFAEGEQGNALLSRFAITAVRNRDVSIAGHEPRGLLHAQLRLPGADLHVICTHLGLLEHHRRHQLSLLRTILQEDIPVDAPLVVAGDFNDWRGHGHKLLQQCGLHEAFHVHTGRLARTFPARQPLLPLDRIYFRNATVCSAEILSSRPWSHLSDHAGLVAELALSQLHGK
jgi:endonuclease/exonuclease/phosphatase family metal-dependent hydrolase